MSTLHISMILCSISILTCFILGLVSKNYSWVDRIWSILPPVYGFIWLSDFKDTPGYILLLLLILLWGIRLTVNFGIKGGYDFNWKEGFTGEDYRWDILQKKMSHPFLFEIFNLFFISSFQLALIFMFTLPLYFYGKSGAPLGMTQKILMAIQFLLLILESLADISQLKFYNRRKKSPWKENPRYALGFNTFGLWKISRHPNYLCEISQWVMVSLILFSSIGELHWSGLGSLVLILLFIGSTGFTESITKSKYSGYTEWTRYTAPWLPIPALGKKAAEKDRFLKQ